jgi:2-amino-4-hydroxy-6-hydroxymethyldihydropteridine diphosphokinase
MSLVYLGLGTNLGDKVQNLNDAVHALSLEVGSVLRLSSFYPSRPCGFESVNEFLNAVVFVETDLSPFELLGITQQIEIKLGRTVKSKSVYTDRLIDIDILLYDSLIIDQPSLKIPHPLIKERKFVLLPLLEVKPELVDPVSGNKFSDFVLP